MQGSEYLDRIIGKRGSAREVEALKAVAAGEYPDAFKKPWPILTVREIIDGKERRLDLEVSPNFFAVGDDGSPFFLPMWPTTEQKVAERFDAVLPTKKLSKAIFEGAALKVPLTHPSEPYYELGVPNDIDNSLAWANANVRRREKGANVFDRIVAGHGKDLLIAPDLTGKRVLLYGAMLPNGGFPIQPASTVHSWDYGPDYSHLVRLIKRRARLDGEYVDLHDVFADPKLSVLVSDEGPFADPAFPINGFNVSKLASKGNISLGESVSKGNISLGESASKALTLPAAYAGKPIEPKGEVEEPVPSFVMPLLLGTVGFALFLVVKD